MGQMSESSVSTQSSLMPASPFGEGEHEYALSSDLAKLCLPAAFTDSYRKLAWVDSICFLFLVIGLVGLKAPRVVERPLSQPTEAVPVVFTPPEEPPKTEPEVKPDEPQPQDTSVETPKVAVVVAAADPSSVAFPVPVEGAVVVKEARFATPPPPVGQTPMSPKTFVPGQGRGGTFPWPTGRDYPREALEQRSQGTVTLYVVVDSSGVPIEVEVKGSSGHYALDRFAAQWVKNKWRWLPGGTDLFFVPYQFKLE